MKITVTETKLTHREIEIGSGYLRSGSWYYMVLNAIEVLKVKDIDLCAENSQLGLYPEISVQEGQFSSLEKATPISEAEFKNAFIRVSLRLEKMMN